MTSALNIPAIKEASFEATATPEERSVRLDLRGSAEIQVSDQLGPFLSRVHEEALRLGVSEVTVDLLKLEFMNSSCFKRLVTWLSMLREGEGKPPYAVRFLSSPRVRWQRASLQALSCFAPGSVTVEARDGA